MKKSTIIGSNIKTSRIESLADNSPLHATSARQYLLDWRTGSSTLHPRSTAVRLCSLARSFNQQDCEVSNKHQTKESETRLSLHLDQSLINENPHAYDKSVVEHISFETGAEHVPVNPTNLDLGADNGLNVTKKRTRGPTVGLE